jgi:signal transduction histidine kinase
MTGTWAYVSARRSLVDRAVEWFFRRTRTYYVEAIFAVLMVWVVVLIVPAYNALLNPLLDAPWRQIVWTTGVFELAVVVSIPGGAWIVRRVSRDFRLWLRGDEDPEVVRAAALWVVGGFPRMVVMLTSWIGVWVFPATIYVGREFGLSGLGITAYLIIVEVLVIGAGVIAFFLVEQIVRPPIAELAARHEDLMRTNVRGVSLQFKVLVLVPLIILYTGMIMASIDINSRGSIDQRLAVTVVVTMLVSATVAVGIAILFRRSLLERFGSLREAHGQVARGDFESRLVSVYGDELDDVANGFNEMVERLARHDQEMRASRARIVAASDEARRRVERDLHDGAQQYLVLLELKLGLLTKAVADDPNAAPLVAELRTDLARALADLRDLAHGIYPAVLESDGLPAALHVAAERSGLEVTVDADGVARSRPEVEAAVYFCCLEALQNAAKHAGADAHVDVRLARANGQLRFEVADDGAGYDVDSIGPSAGLQNMADRIGALGGEVHIESAPGAGTTVQGSVPVGAI